MSARDEYVPNMRPSMPLILHVANEMGYSQSNIADKPPYWYIETEPSCICVISLRLLFSHGPVLPDLVIVFDQVNFKAHVLHVHMTPRNHDPLPYSSAANFKLGLTQRCSDEEPDYCQNGSGGSTRKNLPTCVIVEINPRDTNSNGNDKGSGRDYRFMERGEVAVTEIIPLSAVYHLDRRTRITDRRNTQHDI